METNMQELESYLSNIDKSLEINILGNQLQVRKSGVVITTANIDGDKIDLPDMNMIKAAIRDYEENGNTLTYNMKDAENQIKVYIENNQDNIFFTRKDSIFIFRNKGKTKCYQVTTSGLAEHHCYDMYKKALKVIM